ncbi:hypothetical protein VPH5P1C_0231 [Vibrio phage 5P1c]|nr:hypothetical protein VP495E541_P0232 [Vibrio phage 495E54-1]
MKKLGKIKMTIKKTEYITVEVSEERGYDMPEGPEETFKFIESVKDDYRELAMHDGSVESEDYELEAFTLEEEK